MRISGYLSIIVILSVVVTIFAMMANDAATRYPSSSLNSSSWAGEFDYVDSVNDSIAPIKKSFEEVSNPETGWFTAITSGIAAIPWAVIQVPIMVFKSFAWGGAMITNVLGLLGIPSFMVTAALVLLIVWGVFKAIEIIQRWQI